MSSTLIKGLLWALAAAAVIAAVITAYGNWHDGIEDAGKAAGRAEIQAKWNADVIVRQAAAMTAVKKAREEEQAAAAKLAQKAKEDYENEKIAAVAAARSRVIAGGMSRYIADLNASALSRGMPTPAACPGEFVRERDAGILARQLLGQCSGRYQQLAETTDGLALKLDTALGYIAVVAPAQD